MNTHTALALTTVALSCASSFVTAADMRIVWDNGGGDSSFTTMTNWAGIGTGAGNHMLPGALVDSGDLTNAIIQGAFTVNHTTTPFTAANPFDVLIVRAGATMNISQDLIAVAPFLVGQVGGDGTVNQSAGTVDVTGLNLSNGSGNGFYNLSGSGVVDVTNNINISGPSLLSLMGDTATISATDLNIGTGSTLDFTFGPAGVQPISLSGDFNPNGGDLTIDGSAYTGAFPRFGSPIPLVDYSSNSSTFAPGSISITGISGSLYYDPVTSQLQLIPEPSRAIFLAMGLAGLAFRRKR